MNARCVALAAALGATRDAGVRDIVPGFHTVPVYFDPLKIEPIDACGTSWSVPARSDGRCQRAESRDPIEIRGELRRGQTGRILASVAAFAGLFGGGGRSGFTREAVYRVYMLGFLPGFAYLGSVDRRIAMPRLDTPRLRVPAGSVGIAGVQTGIYPCDTPGGWRIIGRTPLTAVRSSASRAVAVQARADRVKFVAV